MALIVQHFRRKGENKIYLYSDQNVYIEKDGSLYEDAIDLDGQEQFYSETDEHIPGKPYPEPPENDEPDEPAQPSEEESE